MSACLSDLDDAQRDVVRVRWLREAKRFEELWRQQRLAFYWFRVPIIIGAATVPVLVSLSVEKSVTAVIGLAVAILTGLDGFFHLGVRWQLQRRAAQAVSQEGWQFIEMSGVYKNTRSHKDSYTLFLTRLEELLERLNTAYLEVFSDDSKGPRSGLTKE